MQVYRSSTIITAILTLLSFSFSLFLNFFTKADPFWCNTCLGVFGSSLLTFLISIIGYRFERRKTFEAFSIETKEILHNLNKYQVSWNLEEKVDYFLNYHDIRKVDWDMHYGEFAFLFDFRQKNKAYIYQKIYLPILQVNQAINMHIWHFRWYKDGTGRNDIVISKFIEEIESLIMEVVSEELPVSETDAEQKMIMRSTKNKIVCDVSNELNGKYYSLMYGRRAYKMSQT